MPGVRAEHLGPDQMVASPFLCIPGLVHMAWPSASASCWDLSPWLSHTRGTKALHIAWLLKDLHPGEKKK